MPWTKTNALVQAHIAVGGDVACGGGVSDNLCIAFHVHFCSLLCAVDDGHDGSPGVLACYDINAIVGYELYLFPFGNHIVALPPVQDAAAPVEHLVLSLCAPLCGETVFLISGESAREVFSHVSVGHLLGAVH